MELIASLIFALALIHTLMVKRFEHWAHRFPSHAGVLHLLGEVEVVFGFWALILVATMAWVVGAHEALEYLETRQYNEPMFVFVIMVMAASRPIFQMVNGALNTLAHWLPVRSSVAITWLGFVALPLLGSAITEPAAMTLAALVLAPRVFQAQMPEPLKYLALGVLLVNVSIGGTLTSFAAPPVLMVAATWQWSSGFMLATFGWKAALAVLLNGTVLVALIRAHLQDEVEDSNVNRPGPEQEAVQQKAAVPGVLRLVHLLLLAGVVVLAHHPVAFMGLFLLFLGIAHAYERYQSPLILKEALLVAFFLAGLVVVGGLQQWWLEPLVSGMSANALFWGAMGLTAITDNAALTYLGSLIPNLPAASQYSLVAGAVAGGGLTVIANAPNPAAVALLRHGFKEASIGPAGLFAGALLPTLVAAAAFGLL
jgi:hypothetical protein